MDNIKFSSMTGSNYRRMTKEDLNKCVEALKPTYTVITNSERVYSELLEMPFMSEDCVKLSSYVDGTFIINNKELGKILKPRIAEW